MYRFSHRSFFVAMILAGVALVSMDTYIWNETRTFILSNLREDLGKKVSLARQLIDLKAFEQKDLPQLKIFADEIKSLTGHRTTLIDREGAVLVDSELPVDELSQVENHLFRPEVQQAMRTGSGLDVRTSVTINKKLIYYCETLRNNGRITGFIRFAVFSPEYRERTSYLRSVIIWVNLVLFVLVVVGAIIYYRWFNRQLRKVQDTIASQRGEENFLPLPEQTYEEFDTLRGEINNLGEKLEEQKNSLRLQKEYLNSILNSLQEGVAAFDHQGYLLSSNDNFSRLLQIQKEMTPELPYYDWIHFPPIIQDIENYLREHEPVKKRTKYFKETYLEYQVLPLLSSVSEKNGFIVSVQDVTHLHQLETIRQDFVANVSHEFKTPLTSILGFAETLSSGMDDHPELRQKFLSKIENQTRHLENLVTDLLQLSRIEKKEIEKFENLDILPLLTEAMKEFIPIARAKKIKLKLEIEEPQSPLRILGDKNLIHALIANLLTNAIQYNRPKGEIWLRVKAQDSIVRMEVEDTGMGIPPDQLNRVFERFYRVEEARSVYPEGTGLGLAIIKHVVDLLNGKVGVTSKAGQGSLFWVELPMVKG